MKFFLSQVDTLTSCRHLLYIFHDSIYHSMAVSKVTAASHAVQSIDREINELGHFNRL